jgi:capsular polysaccharide biosynthesis protein
MKRIKVRRQLVEGKETNTANVRAKNQKRNTGQEEIDLVELLLMLRRYIVLIVACFAVGMFLAGGYTYRYVTPLYQATAKLYMVSASSESLINLSDLSMGTSLSSDYEELLVMRPVLLAVIEDLGLEDKYSYNAIKGMVSVSSTGSTRILSITATSPDPQEAADIANCLAEKACDFVPEIMETASPNIAENAVKPAGKSSPNITKNAIQGGVCAAAACIAILVIIFLLDDTLKDAEDVESFLGAMPLTVIPEGHIGKVYGRKNSKAKSST